MIGETIAHYRITGKLGAGGMGEVYRATDTKLGREVAIKVLPEAFASDPDRMARFAREAQVLASLNHPNIAAIYGLEESAIVMELVEGADLRGPLPLETALEYAGQIASALEAAHEKGITHRDLKPANVRITPAGIVKVLDFGLAKIAERTAPGSALTSPTLTMRATEAGTIIGTAAYMAPEQARGQTVDKRADIWAFGVVLWETISGKRMFHGETVSDVLAGVLTKPPDLEAVPARVRPLLAACLEKDPRKRLRDVGDWGRLLAGAAPENRRTSSKAPWIAAACLALISAIALWAPWRAPHNVAARPFLQVDLDTGPDEASQPAISSDGMRIVFVSKGHLAMRRLDQADITPLAGTEGATFPFFSPDARWIGFFAAGKLQKMAVEGGVPVTLCDFSNEGGASWGEDDYIVASHNSGLSRIPAGGGPAQPFTESKGDRAGMHRNPQALPGGAGVLFADMNGSGQGSIGVVTAKDGKIKTLVENSISGRYFAGGYLLYTQRGSLLAAPMDATRLELTGPAVPLVDGVSSGFDVSASGALVFRRATAEANRVAAWVYSSGKIDRLPLKPGNYSTPRLSLDGGRVAMAALQEGKQNIWIYDLARETFTRLTSDAGPDNLPTWTPDGEFLAFRSGDKLAWTRSDGSGNVERLAGVSPNAGPYSFSPDGKWLAFWPLQPGSDLWIAPVERPPGALRLGRPQVLLRQPGSKGAPAISPDGRWLAYTSDESGRFEIYVIPFSPPGNPAGGGKWPVSNGGGWAPLWSSKGRQLFYQKSGGRVEMADYTVKNGSFVAGKPGSWSDKLLAEKGLFHGYDVASDGLRILALVAADETKPQAHLRVLLNVDEELRRRTSKSGAKR